MLLIGLLVLVLMVLGVVFWIGLGMIAKTERDQKRAEENAAAILDAAFDGSTNVTFTLNWRTLKYETVMVGANARGYRLVDKNGDPNGAMTLLFEKA